MLMYFKNKICTYVKTSEIIEFKSAVDSEHNAATEQYLCEMKLATAKGKGMKDLGVIRQQISATDQGDEDCLGR